jgi:2-dehydropantoate 2-reductase
VWNAAFNTLSVAGHGATTAEIIGCKPTLVQVRAIMAEVCALAAADGHPLPADSSERYVEDTRKMTPYKTSMLLDYEAGRAMEIEAVVGNAVRAGGRLGVSTPHLDALYGILTLLEQRKN